MARPSNWGNPYRVGDGNPFIGDPIADRAEGLTKQGAQQRRGTTA